MAPIRLAGISAFLAFTVLGATVVMTARGSLAGVDSRVMSVVAATTIAIVGFAAVLSATAVSVSLRARSRVPKEHAAATEERPMVALARELALWTLGVLAVGVVLLILAAAITANDAAIQQTFLRWDLMSDAAPDVLAALWINVEIVLGAQPLILALGLLFAVARLVPGREARPIRAMAILYVDMFRGLPVIIVIYLVGFGLPLTGLEVFRTMSPTLLAIVALTATYSAYVAEAFRSGVEAIHPSQLSAARALGLTYLQTMRWVVVPQATKNSAATLVSYFVALQKDTALVGVIGTIDGFQQAKIFAGNQFNLSAVVLVSAMFVLATIPQTRFADWLFDRWNTRKEA